MLYPDAERDASTLADSLIERADQVCVVAQEEGAAAVTASVSFGENTEYQRQTEGDGAVNRQNFAKKVAAVVNASNIKYPMIQFYVKAAQGAAKGVNGQGGGVSYFLHRLESLLQLKFRALVVKWLANGLVVILNFTAIAMCSGYSHLRFVNPKAPQKRALFQQDQQHPTRRMRSHAGGGAGTRAPSSSF